MKTNILTMAMLTALTLTACNEIPKEKPTETATENKVEKANEKSADEILTSTATDKDGKDLKMSFNNTKNTATINFSGDTIELVGQKVASGMLYKNDTYELSGKGENVELKKDGKTVFKK